MSELPNDEGAIGFALFLGVLSSPAYTIILLDAGATTLQAVVFGALAGLVSGVLFLPAIIVILLEGAFIVVWFLVQLWMFLG